MINILFADGFEEVEALTVVDMARRAGIEVKMISLNNSLQVKGGHNIQIICDILLKDACLSDGIVLPGGIPGVPNIEKNNEALELILNHFKNNKLVAAICAAPTLLGRMGILQDKKAVCYTAMSDELICKIKSDDKVVVDNNVITSKSAGTALDFSFEIIKYIKGEDIAEQIKKSIYYK